MMRLPTDGEIRLARLAAATVRPYSHNSALIMDGERDGTDIVRSALAATMAISDAAECGFAYEIGESLAHAIKSGKI